VQDVEPPLDEHPMSEICCFHTCTTVGPNCKCIRGHCIYKIAPPDATFVPPLKHTTTPETALGYSPSRSCVRARTRGRRHGSRARRRPDEQAPREPVPQEGRHQEEDHQRVDRRRQRRRRNRRTGRLHDCWLRRPLLLTDGA
jgi:hypothetical protein